MRSEEQNNELALVVAFDSTASALAFAKHAPAAGLAGRLIPIPRNLSAGCGMAWKEKPAHKKTVEELIESLSIDDARMVEMHLA